jgi:hypothetical protein
MGLTQQLDKNKNVENKTRQSRRKKKLSTKKFSRKAS